MENPPNLLRKGSMRYSTLKADEGTVVVVESVGRNRSQEAWFVAYRYLGGRASTILPLSEFLQEFSDIEP